MKTLLPNFSFEVENVYRFYGGNETGTKGKLKAHTGANRRNCVKKSHALSYPRSYKMFETTCLTRKMDTLSSRGKI